ncbi:MAG: flagellar biosynthesis anti-sigma factor FlgM [Treponema sp.]|jgi:negative regulator of flagellin synthesis FlgM|nr:flagellar biosynthesis anti-sigma factor FlgM [Treponema sp.]
MTIDRIGSPEPIQPGKRPGQNSRVRETEKSDSISLSSEAIEKAELYRAIELISAAPDIREDRIAELKQKINDPSYLNEQIINATADKIMDVFGF